MPLDFCLIAYGALLFCASQAVSAISRAASNRCTSPGHCFIAGTIILTELGNKKIEEIKVGDKVWSYDEKTGKKALKEVTKLFVNKTRKWIHLVFYNHEGALEKITCTEGHPFFVKDVGWVRAIDLVENDIVTTIDNDDITVSSMNIEIMDNDEYTYNFEVKDYHTYYVGKKGVLVHNECIMDPNDIRYTQKSISKNFKEGGAVDDMIKGLKDGSIEPSDVEPIRIFKQDGKIYSLDNRRLYAFKQAGVSEIRVNWINPSAPNYSSIISKHFTTVTDGLSIIVR